MNGLPAASRINATGTIPICQKAAGCGTTDPLHQAQMGAVPGGTVAAAITGTITLGNSANDLQTPVSGSGYTITFPRSPSSVLPPGAIVTLVATQGAGPIDVCAASGSTNFTTTGSLPTNFSTGTNCYLQTLNRLTITVGSSPGGAAITAGSAGSDTQSAVGDALLTSGTPVDFAGVKLTAGNWNWWGNTTITPSSTNGSTAEIYAVINPTFSGTAIAAGNLLCQRPR
jgi:hypothetical protein